MTDVNYDVKTGRMTKDVEVKEIGGKYLIQGCIATNRSYKKGEEWVEEASFFNFKQWLKSQKQVDYYKQHLTKGAQITIDGAMIQERWKDSEGKNQSMYVIYAERIVPFFATNGNQGGSGLSTDTEGFPEDIPY